MTSYAPPERETSRDTAREGQRIAQRSDTAPLKSTQVTDYSSSLGATPAQLSALDGALLQFRRAVDQRAALPEGQGSEGLSTHDEHTIAADGVRGAPGPLPFLGTIQEAFGRHDISGVQAYTDPSARRANQRLGATAYATGSSVSFGSEPDLHTAAHEAAHVVQQRSGVSLKGGVGQTNDRYEAHADRVADAVVRGDSAEGLLDEFSPQGTATTGVQFDGRAPLEDRGLRERSFELSADYVRFSEQVSTWLARHVMSRTEVPQDDGGSAPIHREDPLVAGSNLRELFEQLLSCARPGQPVTLSATLIAGEHRYESVVFDSALTCDARTAPEPVSAESPPASTTEQRPPTRLATPDIAPHGQLVPTEEAVAAGALAAAAVVLLNAEAFLGAIGGLLQAAVDEIWRRRMIRELQPQVEDEIARKQAEILRVAEQHPGERMLVDILLSEVRMRMPGERGDGQLMNIRFQRCSFRAASQPVQLPRQQRREADVAGSTRITIPRVLHVPLNMG